MNKVSIIFVLILILSFFVGCNKNHDFTDENIVAYIYDTPVYQSDINDYINIKKYFLEGFGYSRYIYIEKELNSTQEAALKFAKYKKNKYENYSIENWHYEYYKTILVKKVLFDYVEKYSKSYDIKSEVDSIVDYHINMVMNYDTISGQVYEGYEVFSILAQEKDIIYKEYIETIYKYAYTNEIEYSILSGYFSKYNISDKLVVFDGENIDESVNYSILVYEKLDQYLTNILNDEALALR